MAHLDPHQKRKPHRDAGPQTDAAEPAPAGHDPGRVARPRHPRAQKVSDPLFEGNDFFDSSDLVQVKYEMLRHVRVEGQTVAKAAAAAGMSRPSFYQAQALFERSGWLGLVPHKRGPRQPHKMSAEVLAFIDEITAAQPDVTTPELQRRIAERFAVTVHRRTLERARNGKKNT